MPLHPLAHTINFLVDPIKAALCAPGVYNQDTILYWAGMAPLEVSGAGYVAGGQLLAGKTQVYDSVARRTVMGSSNMFWPVLTVPLVKFVVLYKDTGVAATSPILGVFVIDVPLIVTGYTFTMQLNQFGLYSVRNVEYNG